MDQMVSASIRNSQEQDIHLLEALTLDYQKKAVCIMGSMQVNTGITFCASHTTYSGAEWARAGQCDQL